MGKVSNFLNELFVNLTWICLGGIVGGALALLTIYIGAWAVTLIGCVVALILILNDE